MPDDNEKQKVQEQETQIKERSPFIWLLVIALVAGLILITNKYKEEIQPAKKEISTVAEQIKASAEAKKSVDDEKEKFPLTTWLIVAGGLLLLRAVWEFYVSLKSGKTEAQWMTPDMLSVGLGIVTIIILTLQAFYPDQWWYSLCQSPLGKPLLFALGALVLVWYILPGTGSITLALGKPFCIIVGVGLITILVFTATGGELKENNQWIWQKWFESKKIEAKSPPAPRETGWMRWSVTKELQHLTKVYSGEWFEYKTIQTDYGFKTYHYKLNNYHCFLNTTLYFLPT